MSQQQTQISGDGSSSKASRKGTASAEISDSSLTVFKQGSKSTSMTNDGQTTQTISNTSVKPQDPTELMAAIQKIRLVKNASGG